MLGKIMIPMYIISYDYTADMNLAVRERLKLTLICVWTVMLQSSAKFQKDISILTLKQPDNFFLFPIAVRHEYDILV